MIERFFIENQSQVKRNDTLGILKNTASLEDVQTFCNVLTNIEWYYRTNDINYLQDYPFNLIMGKWLRHTSNSPKRYVPVSCIRN